MPLGLQFLMVGGLRIHSGPEGDHHFGTQGVQPIGETLGIGKPGPVETLLPPKPWGSRQPVKNVGVQRKLAASVFPHDFPGFCLGFIALQGLNVYPKHQRGRSEACPATCL